MLFIGIIWLILSFGLKYSPSHGVSLAVWLIPGMIIWLYFAETLASASTVISDYSFLLKQIDFNVNLLPVVRLVTHSFTHFILLAATIVIVITEGESSGVYNLQIIYYYIYTTVLLYAFSRLTSSVSLFLKDINQIVHILITFGFWLTPVFWDITLIPEKYQWLVKLNPVYYPVAGYRESIINSIPFWDKPYEILYYWCFAVSALAFGNYIFKSLRPYFEEVA